MCKGVRRRLLILDAPLFGNDQEIDLVHCRIRSILLLRLERFAKVEVRARFAHFGFKSCSSSSSSSSSSGVKYAPAGWPDYFPPPWRLIYPLSLSL